MQMQSDFNVDLTNEAAELMRKADAGDAEAQYLFATYLIREPDNSYRKDLTFEEVSRAMRYMQLSAAQGHFHGIAADELGMIYYDGEIVPLDYTKAKLWFNTALLKGIPTSAYMLGECAYCGHGEDIDYEKAAQYYLQAAAGYINAMIRLGDMYMCGNYLPLDPAFAQKIYSYVLDDENKLHQKHGFFSSAHEMVRNRLDDIERNDVAPDCSLEDETVEQLRIRSELLEIMRDKAEKSAANAEGG